MKKEFYYCDVCDKEVGFSSIYPASIVVGGMRRNFDVCKQCWEDYPKNVFKNMFGRFFKRKTAQTQAG